MCRIGGGRLCDAMSAPAAAAPSPPPAAAWDFTRAPRPLDRCGITSLAYLLRGSSSLTHLNLQHSRITDASLDRLGEELKGLVNVSLKGCAWVSERGVEGLKRRCPKLNEVGWAPSPRPSVDDSENGGGGPY